MQETKKKTSKKDLGGIKSHLRIKKKNEENKGKIPSRQLTQFSSTGDSNAFFLARGGEGYTL